jgi:parallel beta-helix repeat protein
MTQKISPFLEGKYGWEYGESGWNSGMDENLLKFSFLFDGNIDSIVSSLPAASNGKAVFLTTDNRLYFAVGTTWYSTPVPKWFQLTNRLTGKIFQFNGTSLVEVETSAELGTRVDAIELTVSTLGSAAFEESSYFATQSALEVASAQANTYTDEVVSKKGIVSVLDYITNTVDGVTSNQSGLLAAVAAAYAAGADLYWPAGTYVSDANIPNFHSVRHVGAGVIKRGADTFKISQRGSQANALYVATTGSAANDGLSAAQPITLQAAVDALGNYGPVLDGNWSVNLAAGTYTGGGVFGGLSSKNWVVVQGPDVGGHPNVPTAILDGTGQTATAGIYATGAGLKLHIKNIKSINWRSNSVSSGFVFANGAEAYLENCHADNCLWAGANFDSVPFMRVKGGIYENSTYYGLRCRAQVSFSIGYQGAASANRPIIRGCGAGIQLRDSCSGHVDYCDISACSTGITLSNQSRVNAESNTISSCNLGIYAESSSTVADQTTVFSGNTLDRRLTGGSTRYQEEDNLFYQESGVKRFSFGKAAYTGSVNSSTAYMFGTDRDTAASMAFMVPDSTVAQLIFGRASATAAGIISYRHADATPSWRIQCEGAVSASFFGTDFRPGADNARSLGTPSVRWSTVYAGTGTISTSDERSKQQIKPIDEAALRAWARVEYVQYKFNDAVEQKGDGARWHFGLIAQRVKEAFEAEGLDAFDYGLLCYDEWDETPAVEEQRDDEGNVVVEAEPYRPAGNRYGIRYEEAIALECAYLRSKIDRL